MTRQRRRTIALEMALDAARRVGLYEIRYFRCCLRYSRTGRERTRLRRDRWRKMAIAYALDFREGYRDLKELGLAARAATILAGCGAWIREARLAYCRSHGLDLVLADRIGCAVESLPGLAAGPYPEPSVN